MRIRRCSGLAFALRTTDLTSEFGRVLYFIKTRDCNQELDYFDKQTDCYKKRVI
jgi:hypothetical protein